MIRFFAHHSVRMKRLHLFAPSKTRARAFSLQIGLTQANTPAVLRQDMNQGVDDDEWD